MRDRSPTLDDLIALNHEIAALVHAGIPLELGLRGLSGSVGSRLGQLCDRLATRMTNGRTLPDALAEEGPAVSPIYTAVIAAGLASGKLPEALKTLSSSGQIVQETRRRVLLAAIYPMICACVAYSMFCAFITLIAPRIIASVETFPQGWPIHFLRMLHENSAYATQVIPATVIALIVVIALLRNTVARGPWHYLTSFRWVSGRSVNWAQFTEILRLQVEHSAPLAQAFVLAADTTDDRRLHHEARQVSEELTRGATLLQSLRFATSLPPLVRWMLATGEKQGTLAITLQQLTDIYRRRVLRRAAIIRVWLPVAMTFLFTSVIGLAYGLAFFIPLRAFLMELAQE